MGFRLGGSRAMMLITCGSGFDCKSHLIGPIDALGLQGWMGSPMLEAGGWCVDACLLQIGGLIQL